MTELRELLEGSKAKVEALQADDHSEEAKRGIAQLGGAYRALGMWDEALETFDRGLRELLSNVVYGGSGGVGLVFLFRLGVGSDSVAEFHAQDHVLQAV